MSKYIYSIISSTLNHKVDCTRLTSEIRSSAITKSLDYVTTSGDELDIYFKDVLSTNEQTLLSSVLSLHTGETSTDTSFMADGRSRVYSSVRPWGNRISYNGYGDDISGALKIGNGSKLKIVHTSGGNSTETLYADFNTIANQTYIFQFLATFDGCFFDELTAVAVPRVTTTSVGTNTNYNNYFGVIVPAAGDGTLSVQSGDINLVQVIEKETGIKPAGYWNADFNSTTGLFENITAAPLGNGGYNMFSSELPLSYLARGLFLNGTCNGWLPTPSQEVDRIGHGMRIKFSVATNTPDHDWTLAITMIGYREKT